MKEQGVGLPHKEVEFWTHDIHCQHYLNKGRGRRPGEAEEDSSREDPGQSQGGRGWLTAGPPDGGKGIGVRKLLRKQKSKLKL